jgi:hypothetical protein
MSDIKQYTICIYTQYYFVTAVYPVQVHVTKLQYEVKQRPNYKHCRPDNDKNKVFCRGLER